MNIFTYQSRVDSAHYLAALPAPAWQKQVDFDRRLITIDPSEKRQSVLGFGGAITEATTSVYALLSPEQKKAFIRAYFGEDGAAYSWERIPLGSTDFGLGSYCYVAEGDLTSKAFSLKHEEQYLFPFLKDVNDFLGHQPHLLASPWTPPAFYKDNHTPQHGGHLLPQYRKNYAAYETTYFQAMAKRGYTFDLLTIQNEPEAVQTWDSCIYTPEEEAAYIPYLRTALDQAGFKDIGLYIWDHNRDEIVRRSNVTLAAKEVRSLVKGVAYHWYCSNNHHNLDLVHEAFPDLHLLFTEGCVELAHPTTFKETALGVWRHGEIYGENMLEDFNHWNEGWIDWNLLLNEQGGPNYVGNFCEAPVMFDRKKKTLTFNPSFYFISHISRFFKEGGRIVRSENDYEKGVFVASCLNPDSSLAIVIQNSSDKTISPSVLIQGLGSFIPELPPHSITTYRIVK
jgi:glucosylceramidase